MQSKNEESKVYIEYEGSANEGRSKLEHRGDSEWLIYQILQAKWVYNIAVRMWPGRRCTLDSLERTKKKKQTEFFSILDKCLRTFLFYPRDPSWRSTDNPEDDQAKRCISSKHVLALQEGQELQWVAGEDEEIVAGGQVVKET